VDDEQLTDRERARRLQRARQLVRKIPLHYNDSAGEAKELAMALTYWIEGQPGIHPGQALLALQIVFAAIVQALPDPRERKAIAKTAAETTEMLCSARWPET
jgi:hypothetical protein